MDRYTDIDQPGVEAMRVALVAESTHGADNDLDPEDRKDRTVVASYQDENGDWQPTKLVGDDDVLWCGCPGRVVGPARGRDWVSIYYDPWFGSMAVPIHLSYISDRAPADENEPEPHMPLIPEPEQELMFARAAGEQDPKKAAKEARQEERDARRDRREQLKQIIARMPKHDAKTFKKVLREKGILGPDDKND